MQLGQLLQLLWRECVICHVRSGRDGSDSNLQHLPLLLSLLVAREKTVFLHKGIGNSSSIQLWCGASA
jgi:hypothetical protein